MNSKMKETTNKKTNVLKKGKKQEVFEERHKN